MIVLPFVWCGSPKVPWLRVHHRLYSYGAVGRHGSSVLGNFFSGPEVTQFVKYYAELGGSFQK